MELKHVSQSSFQPVLAISTARAAQLSSPCGLELPLCPQDRDIALYFALPLLSEEAVGLDGGVMSNGAAVHTYSSFWQADLI
jgi:hypothetical protein